MLYCSFELCFSFIINIRNRTFIVCAKYNCPIDFILHTTKFFLITESSYSIIMIHNTTVDHLSSEWQCFTIYHRTLYSSGWQSTGRSNTPSKHHGRSNTAWNKSCQPGLRWTAPTPHTMVIHFLLFISNNLSDFMFWFKRKWFGVIFSLKN